MKQFNFKDILKKNIPSNFKRPRRSQIYVGYRCHQKCGFCYYKPKCNEEMFHRDYVLRQIDLELAYGIKDIEITGGEPSECEDLRFYCEYIKTKSPNSKIAIITNGGLWKSNVWDLIDEVLISYHLSKDDNSYDKSIFPLGSTFDKVMKTVEKARNTNKLIRTNTVIGTFNIDTLNLIVDDILNFIKPDMINFLPINLFDDANMMGMDRYIDYNKLRPILKREIDKIEERAKGTMISVRFMPFCDMEGYEKYILGTFQHIYDFFDWNAELCGYYLLDYLRKYKTNEDILKYLGVFGTRTMDLVVECTSQHYEKKEECLFCKYYLICDGVEKTKNHKLLDNIKVSRGKMIKNYMEFLGNRSEKKYEEVYGAK